MPRNIIYAWSRNTWKLYPFALALKIRRSSQARRCAAPGRPHQLFILHYNNYWYHNNLYGRFQMILTLPAHTSKRTRFVNAWLQNVIMTEKLYLFCDKSEFYKTLCDNNLILVVYYWLILPLQTLLICRMSIIVCINWVYINNFITYMTDSYKHFQQFFQQPSLKNIHQQSIFWPYTRIRCISKYALHVNKRFT